MKKGEPQVLLVPTKIIVWHELDEEGDECAKRADASKEFAAERDESSTIYLDDNARDGQLAGRLTASQSGGKTTEMS